MNTVSRRSLLGGMGALALGTVASSGALPVGAADAAVSRGARSPRSARSVVGAFPDPGLDASHATPELTRMVTSLFRDKTARDVDRLMTHFSKELLFYNDGTLGARVSGWRP